MERLTLEGLGNTRKRGDSYCFVKPYHAACTVSVKQRRLSAPLEVREQEENL